MISASRGHTSVSKARPKIEPSILRAFVRTSLIATRVDVCAHVCVLIHRCVGAFRIIHDEVHNLQVHTARKSTVIVHQCCGNSPRPSVDRWPLAAIKFSGYETLGIVLLTLFDHVTSVLDYTVADSVRRELFPAPSKQTSNGDLYSTTAHGHTPKYNTICSPLLSYSLTQLKPLVIKQSLIPQVFLLHQSQRFS